jgi:hypothetical protein
MLLGGGRAHRPASTGSAYTRSGLWAVFMGLLGLLTAFVVVAIRWNDESGVAALGAVASSIGAILSAYFGLQYAASAGEHSRGPTRRRRGR